MNKIPLTKAIFRILLSVLLISGSSSLGVVYYKMIRQKQKHDAANNIVAIIQSTLDREELKTVYLAQLLSLSVDQPINIYNFSAKEGRNKLLESPLIKEASITKIKPGILYIEYEKRHPIAYLGDVTNAAIDKDGFVFPFKPFFTPKRLPEIYLGSNNLPTELQWGTQIANPHLELALELLELAQNHCCQTATSIEQIDVSKAFALSYGQKQIVLIFEQRHSKVDKDGATVTNAHRHLVRLGVNNYHQQLANYISLQNYLRNQSAEMQQRDNPKTTIIDLRLSKLAFINTES